MILYRMECFLLTSQNPVFQSTINQLFHRTYFHLKAMGIRIVEFRKMFLWENLYFRWTSQSHIFWPSHSSLQCFKAWDLCVLSYLYVTPIVLHKYFLKPIWPSFLGICAVSRSSDTNCLRSIILKVSNNFRGHQRQYIASLY